MPQQVTTPTQPQIEAVYSCKSPRVHCVCVCRLSSFGATAIPSQPKVHFILYFHRCFYGVASFPSPWRGVRALSIPFSFFAFATSVAILPVAILIVVLIPPFYAHLHVLTHFFSTPSTEPCPFPVSSSFPSVSLSLPNFFCFPPFLAPACLAITTSLARLPLTGASDQNCSASPKAAASPGTSFRQTLDRRLEPETAETL